MPDINWSKLKSGTDIRGTALKEGAGEVNLTVSTSEYIGMSFATWLKNFKNKPPQELTVAVGTDSRLTADKLKKGLISGLNSLGIEVYDCGMASTPAMFMSTIMEGHNYDGAVMITASHLPYDKNGFKFFTSQGGLEGEDIKKILALAEQNDFPTNSNNNQKNNISKIDLISDYAEFIVEKIKSNVFSEVDQNKPLKNFNIIVDAGNGVGGFFVNKILKPLGANTEGSQYLKPDGNFPHHIPNPENEKAISAIKKAVIEQSADLGIIFDTDVDRAAVVDSKGEAINRNRLIALASAIVLKDHSGSTIVTDSVTSKGLTTFIEEKLGGRHHRYKRGYKNVINEALKLNKQGKEAPLAIETSGHAAFRENHFLDDGAYLVAKILIKMANIKARNNRNLSELIADLDEAEITKEYRMKIKLDDFKEYGQQVLDELKTHIKENTEWQIPPKNYEGVRVDCGANDWFLLRMSLHDPVLVLNIECDHQEKLNLIKNNLQQFLENFSQINREPLL